jgi:hypothetical protein
MEEEVEALLSVYWEDMTLIDLTHEHTSALPLTLLHNSNSSNNRKSQQPTSAISENRNLITKKISFMARPRNETTSTSFVEALLTILLPSSYPDSHQPIVEIERVSGLADDGRQLANQIHTFLSKQPLGEMVLFALIDSIFDHLDQFNDGECMICLQSLLKPPPTADEKLVKETTNSTFSLQKNHHRPPPLSLKTDCYHCFHLRCLCQWACEYFDQLTDQTKKVSSEQQNLSLRALQGEIKTSETHLKRTQEEIQMIEQSLADTRRKLSLLHDPSSSLPSSISSTSPSSSSHPSPLEEMRHQYTQLSLQISKSSGKKKEKLFETANRLKQQILAEERRGGGTSSTSSTDHASTSSPGGTDESQETVLELEEEMRRFQAQLPELENKVKRCQTR